MNALLAQNKNDLAQDNHQRRCSGNPQMNCEDSMTPNDTIESDQPRRILGRHTERGVTLIEIIIVVVVLGSLITLVAQRVVGTQDRLKIKNAKNMAMVIDQKFREYQTYNRNFPSSSQGFQALLSPKSGAPYLDKMPLDPWGNEYKYSYPAQKSKAPFDVVSAGPDGQFGTGDDVGNWEDSSS